MSKCQFDTQAPAAAKSDPVQEIESPDTEITSAAGYAPHLHGALATGSAPRPEFQAVVLAQASGGQLARAGGTLLQLQRDYGNRYVQRIVNHARQADSPNRTSLPDQLKAGIESLSGISLDNVKVHYNSAKPAQLNALAYAQGSDILVAPGQERHLPHEAWHVVQQAQGRVQPTMQMKDGIQVNDDEGLEHEADVMGAKAVDLGRESTQFAAKNFGRAAATASGVERDLERHGVANVGQTKEPPRTPLGIGVDLTPGPVQRYIVNVEEATSIDKLDVLIYTAIHRAYQQKEGYDQPVAEWDKADYSKVKQDDNVYFVGHGAPGKIGKVVPYQLADRLRSKSRGLPEGFKGELISYSCASGVAGPEENETPVEALAEKLGSRGDLYSRAHATTVRGARGYVIHPRGKEPVVVGPEFEGQVLGAQSEVNVNGTTFASVGKEFEAFKKEHPSIPERANEAVRLTQGLVEALISREDVQQTLLGKDLWNVIQPKTRAIAQAEKKTSGLNPDAASWPAYPRVHPSRSRVHSTDNISDLSLPIQAMWILRNGKRTWVPDDYVLQNSEVMSNEMEGDARPLASGEAAMEVILASFNLESVQQMQEIFAAAFEVEPALVDLSFGITDRHLPRFRVKCERIGLELICNQEDEHTMRLDSIRVGETARGQGRSGPATVKCLLDLTKRNNNLRRWILVAAEELGPYAWASMGWAVRSDIPAREPIVETLIKRFGYLAEELKPNPLLMKKLNPPIVQLMKENARICDAIADRNFEAVPREGWGGDVVRILQGNPRNCLRDLANVDKKQTQIFIPRIIGREVRFLSLGQAILLTHDPHSGATSGAVTWGAELIMGGKDQEIVETYLGSKLRKE